MSDNKSVSQSVDLIEKFPPSLKVFFCLATFTLVVALLEKKK